MVRGRLSSPLAWLDPEEMFVHYLTAGATASTWGSSSAWPSFSILSCLSTVYSSAARWITVLGQGGALPTTGILMSLHPYPEAGEGFGTLVAAIEEPGCLVHFINQNWEISLGTALAQSTFLSHLPPQKRKKKKKESQLFWTHLMKEQIRALHLQTCSSPLTSLPLPLACRSNPAGLFCLVCLFCFDWKIPISCSSKIVAGKLESETSQIHE